MKYTDYNKVFELAKNLVLDVGAINTLCEELKQKMAQLNASFFDDGIEEIKTFVSTLQKRLEASQEALEIIADQLCDYGELLRQVK